MAREDDTNTRRHDGTRVKVGTVLDRALVERLRVASRRSARPLSDLLEEAVGDYLARQRTAEVDALDAVESTWASQPTGAQLLRRLFD